MIAFGVLSALFVIGALSLVVPPLLARHKRVRFSRNEINLVVHRDQLREMDADMRAGTLDAEHYGKARQELEARLLEDVADDEITANPPRSGHVAAIVASIAIPLLAMTLYIAVGTPQALRPGQLAQRGAAHDVSGRQVEGLVKRLAARMRENPEDPAGWVLLGRSYIALGRVPEAVQAYDNAAARLPHEAGVLADYADILAVSQGQRFAGKPEKLVSHALEIDPTNLKALALAGNAAFERNDYSGAIRYWERILPLVSSDSEGVGLVRARIANARALTGKLREKRSAPGQ